MTPLFPLRLRLATRARATASPSSSLVGLHWAGRYLITRYLATAAGPELPAAWRSSILAHSGERLREHLEVEALGPRDAEHSLLEADAARGAHDPDSSGVNMLRASEMNPSGLRFIASSECDAIEPRIPLLFLPARRDALAARMDAPEDRGTRGRSRASYGARAAHRSAHAASDPGTGPSLRTAGRSALLSPFPSPVGCPGTLTGIGGVGG